MSDQELANLLHARVDDVNAVLRDMGKQSLEAYFWRETEGAAEILRCSVYLEIAPSSAKAKEATRA